MKNDELRLTYYLQPTTYRLLMWKDLSLWLLIVATFISWGAWGLVLNKISPIESPQIALPAFYLSIFLSLLTTFAVIGSLLRKFGAPGKNMLRCINISLRQGTILAGIAVIALFFQQLQSFTWWMGVLLLMIGVILEALFWNSGEK